MEENKIVEQIEELAQLQFTDEELAKIMQVPVKDFIKKYRNSIDRGRLLAEAEVRRAILQLAKQGSTPAQKQFMELNQALKMEL
jgi:predicted DNA-binding protein (UPF0278 family)